MAINWISGFIIPLSKVVFIGGFILFCGYYIYKASSKLYSNDLKWFIKYKILKKKYNEKTMLWCLKAIERNMDYYQVKKYLMIKMIPMLQVKETMWIYSQIIKEMKGGVENGGKYKGSDRKNQGTTRELPSF